MGAEVFVSVDSWAAVGRVLDAQRAVARADRPVARPWLFRSGVESTRFALLRFNRALLDWAPVVEHVPRVLHRSLSTAFARTADPVRRAAVTDYSSVFCIVPSG